MALFCVVINKESVSLFRLPFCNHVQVIPWTNSFVSRLNYSCSFSSNFSFLVFFNLLFFCLSLSWFCRYAVVGCSNQYFFALIKYYSIPRYVVSTQTLVLANTLLFLLYDSFSAIIRNSFYFFRFSFVAMSRLFVIMKWALVCCLSRKQNESTKVR